MSDRIRHVAEPCENESASAARGSAVVLLREFALIAVLFLGASTEVLAADASRHAEVAERGSQVMPFALDRTTHIFTKTSVGGVQQVVAKNAADASQISMIRMHLSQIASAFAHGDFAGPTHIHGADMPGLAELKSAKPGSVLIRYSDIQSGGQIEYTTKNANLRSAIHAWFDAQVSDHGADAMAGHDHMQHRE